VTFRGAAAPAREAVAPRTRPAAVPGATYRLQLGAGFTFRDARELVPYLAELGISDCYLSPILQPGSSDSAGYDVADHGRLSEGLGGEAGFRELTDTLRHRGMGVLVDVVPNHMGIWGPRNRWWQDVLEHGAASPFAAYFDIDWQPPKPELRNRVLLPILEDHYGRVLEGQGLRLEYTDGAFVIRYHDAILPVSPCTYPRILADRLPELAATLGPDDPHLREIQRIVEAARHLPPRTETAPARQAERAHETARLKARLDALTGEAPVVKGWLAETVWRFNGVPGHPDSFDRLDGLLGAQVYRVAYWGVAGDEINYRRFFDVNDLAAIRMEEPAVFEAAHRLLLRLIRENRITGLRIDHPDGLYAPVRYFRELQEHCVRALGAAPSASPVPASFYVVVEKVLMPGEALPDHWPVHGTTGYELLNALNGIFVDPKGARVMEQTDQRFTGSMATFADVAHEAKRLVTDTIMASELNVLGRRLGRLAEQRRESRDFTERLLTDGLREIVACFPVYRTYIGDDGAAPAERDRRHVEEAVAAAKQRSPTVNPSVFDFIGELLRDGRDLDFVRRFQQITGPVTAKGVEDTAFYRYNRLVSLNEVGGRPDRFGTPLREFHRLNAERLARWPDALSTLSTHDTKRSEDVRARINVLSEIPLEWRIRVRTWRRLNRRHRTLVDGQPAPDPNDEYLLYQTLVGAWPLRPGGDAEHATFVERIQRYMLKALREAKIRASWVHPNPAYDAAMSRFVAALLDRSARPPAAPGRGRLRSLIAAIVPSSDGNPFLADFQVFQERVATAGLYNSLAQTLLKLVVPGVPDTYQGTETWDFSLVDPDNRRPVDYAPLRSDLHALRERLAEPNVELGELVGSLLSTKEDGRIKLYLVHRLLEYRRAHRPLFQAGTYVPLEAEGARRDHVVAIGRQLGAASVIAVVPRFLARLHLAAPPVGPGVWAGTTLGLSPMPGARAYRNVLTGQRVDITTRDGRPGLSLEAVLDRSPVALLEAIEEH
jgi:(1->4)-alpha-D-glucan 1-alpha-D-glucosylmutase